MRPTYVKDVIGSRNSGIPNRWKKADHLNGKVEHATFRLNSLRKIFRSEVWLQFEKRWDTIQK